MAKSMARALAFWAYLALAVSVVAIFFASIRPADRHSSFLGLPADLRRHYFGGKLVKVQLAGQNRPSTQIFTVEDGPRDESAEIVVLLHGLGCSSYSFRHVMKSLAAAGIRSVAVDLPGSGFSDKLGVGGSENSGGALGLILGVYREIKEKGIFWGFDRLVETGEIPNAQPSLAEDERSASHIEMSGRAVGQVFGEMPLREPVHLVVHDSAWGAAVHWVSANPTSVRSITFLDSSPAELPAFPFRFLETPVLGDLLLRSQAMFGWLVKLCCLRTADRQEAAEIYRVLLQEEGGKSAVVEAGKGLNYSFDLREWAGSERVKELQFQVLWSNSWSDRWINEGRRIAAAVPQARFAWHSGGRWPQEDAAEEIAEMIARFVLSLPKPIRQADEEPSPEHIEKASNEESGSYHHHQHHADDHEFAAGYFSTYGLGKEWGG